MLQVGRTLVRKFQIGRDVDRGREGDGDYKCILGICWNKEHLSLCAYSSVRLWSPNTFCHSYRSRKTPMQNTLNNRINPGLSGGCVSEDQSKLWTANRNWTTLINEMPHRLQKNFICLEAANKYSGTQQTGIHAMVSGHIEFCFIAVGKTLSPFGRSSSLFLQILATNVTRRVWYVALTNTWGKSTMHSGRHS